MSHHKSDTSPILGVVLCGQSPSAITARDPPQDGPVIAQKPAKTCQFGWHYDQCGRIEAWVRGTHYRVDRT